MKKCALCNSYNVSMATDEPCDMCKSAMRQFGEEDGRKLIARARESNRTWLEQTYADQRAEEQRLRDTRVERRRDFVGSSLYFCWSEKGQVFMANGTENRITSEFIALRLFDSSEAANTACIQKDEIPSRYDDWRWWELTTDDKEHIFDQREIHGDNFGAGMWGYPEKRDNIRAFTYDYLKHYLSPDPVWKFGFYRWEIPFILNISPVYECVAGGEFEIKRMGPGEGKGSYDAYVEVPPHMNDRHFYDPTYDYDERNPVRKHLGEFKSTEIRITGEKTTPAWSEGLAKQFVESVTGRPSRYFSPLAHVQDWMKEAAARYTPNQIADQIGDFLKKSA